ncbi:GNAT family N-acetyltransferase [Acholeplasma vituli]|uniref:GNAT family N-acetyltransferase n=1 Tax=Paracholeplasma vituli TaxID=69473 RepID=A0ABT2PYW9_9MOLU|nr:GNAT family N-acetyltransferase [Paracholeplasma vituli]MCU0104858.1 GNAT family N-acetyltransferase [Paracholeplasma vituli]
MIIMQKTFNDLSTTELYQILKLRSDVFVVEQNAVYLDLDDLDYHSTHFFVVENNEIVSYVRTIPFGYKFEDASSLGRVVTYPKARGKGYSRQLINRAIEHLFKTESIIRIEGQSYLKAFYESFGFVVTSDIYLVDGIDHYALELKKRS